MKKRRLLAATIDWGIITTVSALISVFLQNHHISDFKAFNGYVMYFVIFILVIFKDLMFRNASLGKRLLGLRIVQGDSKNKASVINIIKRNLLLVVPVIFYLEFYRISKGELRLADIWFNTNVVRCYE